MLTKDGQRMRVAWSLQIMCDPEGKPQTMLLSGMPCSDPPQPRRPRHAASRSGRSCGPARGGSSNTAR